MVKEGPQKRAYVTSGMFFKRSDLVQSTFGKNKMEVGVHEPS